MPPEEPILIAAEHLDVRVDFERGMPALPRVTLALLASHAALFAVEAARGALEDPEALKAVGALTSDALSRGEPWRLWSATFLHGSVDHLIGNALALYVAGMACEHGFGRVQFAALYVVAGLAGSLASVAGLPPGVPAVGASGAIFGLMGAAAVLFLRHSRRLIVRDRRTGWVLAAWVAYSVAMGLFTPFVDNRAHGGGLLAGAAVALLLFPRVLDRGVPTSPAAWGLFGAAAGTAAVLTTLWLAHLLR